jgi:hypothetical protein
MKIVYTINSIRGLGGIQKVTLLKANALADIPQNKVYIIVTDNWMNHPLTHELSPKITFINLQINYYKNLGLTTSQGNSPLEKLNKFFYDEVVPV